MRAAKWEFEQRFWIFGLIFATGFGLYAVDHKNVVEWITDLLIANSPPSEKSADTIAHMLFLLGAAVVFLTAMFRTWATAYLKTEIVHDQQQHSDVLVADGPYRYTRNPLYFANIFLGAGMGLMASRAGWLFLVAGMWVYGYRLIGREEEMLVATQGEAYRRYAGAVPRFWPSLTPRVPSSGARPHWGQAVAGEIFFWFFGLALLSFAITFNMAIVAIVMAAGFGIYFMGVSLIRKRAKAAR